MHITQPTPSKRHSGAHLHHSWSTWWCCTAVICQAGRMFSTQLVSMHRSHSKQPPTQLAVSGEPETYTKCKSRCRLQSATAGNLAAGKGTVKQGKAGNAQGKQTWLCYCNLHKCLTAYPQPTHNCLTADPHSTQLLESIHYPNLHNCFQFAGATATYATA